jgi:hypothetical protein
MRKEALAKQAKAYTVASLLVPIETLPHLLERISD